jgi:hypothetical protein
MTALGWLPRKLQHGEQGWWPTLEAYPKHQTIQIARFSLLAHLLLLPNPMARRMSHGWVRGKTNSRPFQVRMDAFVCCLLGLCTRSVCLPETRQPRPGRLASPWGRCGFGSSCLGSVGTNKSILPQKEADYMGTLR